MLNEYEKELINEILSEVENLKKAVLEKNKDAYVSSEERIKLIAKILKEPVLH